MRTDLERVNACIDFNTGECDRVKMVAAMKEAREEYASLFAEYTRVNGWYFDEEIQFWTSSVDGGMLTDEQLHLAFNQHLAAIEAEKERGNNNG